MKKVLIPNIEAGQKQTSDPRLIEEIVKDFLMHSSSPFAQAYRRQQAEQNAMQQAELNEMHQAEQALKHQAELSAKLQAEQTAKQQANDRRMNTMLCVNLKTQLLDDAVVKPGKPYQGVLTKDVEVDEFFCDEHFTFIESAPAIVRRNPRVFDGQYITITRWADGTYRTNLRPVAITDGFDIVAFATAVSNELLWSLESLIGK